jgi:toxin ParE1/3/4
VARIEFAPEAAEDLARIIDDLRKLGAAELEPRARAIIDALDVLESNPWIGQPAGDALRELVIGRDARGYVALYRYLPELDLVLALAVRSQREAGYVGRVDC